MRNLKKIVLRNCFFFVVLTLGCNSFAKAGCSGNCGVTYPIINNLDCDFGFEWISACGGLSGYTFSIPAHQTWQIPIPCLTMVPDCPDGCASGFYLIGVGAISPPPIGAKVWDLPDPGYCGCPNGVRVTWTPNPGGGGMFTIDCY